MTDDRKELLLPEVPDLGHEVVELRAKVEHLERMRETEKLAVLELYKQHDELKEWVGRNYMRIKALEGEAKPELLSWSEKPSTPTPAGELIEQVASALAHMAGDGPHDWCSWTDEASAAILLIATEVERRGDQGLDLDPGETAEWLRREAGDA